MTSGASASASCCLPMDYETKIFPQIGGYGRYNRLAVVFSWFPTFAVALNLFSDVYFTQVPKLYYSKTDPTQLPSFFSNYSGETYLKLTIPWADGQGFSHCERYKYPANITDLSGKVPREKENCSLGWEYPTVVGLQSNILTEWNLVCKDEWKIPRQHVCFMVGWIVGYIFLGSLCDWLGRRRGFLFSITLSSLFGVSVCLSSSAPMFLMLRLCQGAMLAGVFVSSYVLRLELSDPPHRLMVAMIGGFFAVSAELLLPGLAILCQDWPVLQAVATLPLILLISYWCYDGCLDVMLENIAQKPDRYRIIVASHNQESVRRAAKRMEELGIEKDGGSVCFGQLLGMCDHVSLTLAKEGYPVYKSVPYGSVEDTLPYLVRRAQENRTVLQGIHKERDLLRQELRHRMRRSMRGGSE